MKKMSDLLVKASTAAFNLGSVVFGSREEKKALQLDTDGAPSYCTFISTGQGRVNPYLK